MLKLSAHKYGAKDSSSDDDNAASGDDRKEDEGNDKKKKKDKERSGKEKSPQKQRAPDSVVAIGALRKDKVCDIWCHGFDAVILEVDHYMLAHHLA